MTIKYRVYPFITPTDKVKDLGVILDRYWKFDEHIESIIAKTNKTLGFIKRTAVNFTSIDTISYLFKTLVTPVLTYASVVWTPYTQEKIDRLNSVVKKFLRFAAYKNGTPMNYWDHDYRQISIMCNIHKIESLHKYFDLSFMIDSLRSGTSSSDFGTCLNTREPNYLLRYFRPLHEQISRKDYIYHSPVHRLTRLWNSLPEATRTNFLQQPIKEEIKANTLEFF